MAERQYIGARYVPLYYENSLDPTSSEWEPNVNYYPLTIVSLPNMHSYQSKKFVPASVGSPASNPEYWYDQGYASAYYQALQDQIDDMKDGDVPGSLQEQINDNADDIELLMNMNILKGKKILIIGDSISDPNIGIAGTMPVWSEYFQTMLSGVASVTIKARSGMQMIDCPNFLTTITDWDYDIVLVFLGTNDFASSVEMGDYLGNDNTRFCDALKATYIYIRDHIMSVTGHREDIYFITPIYGRPYQNSRKMPMWFYNASITGFCKRWGCKWINGLTFPMSGELYSGWALVDDVHPTTTYAKIMSEYILGKLFSGGDVVSYNNDAMYTDLSSLLLSGVTGTLKASFENEYLDIHFDVRYTPTQTNQQITDVFPFDISDLIDNNLYAPCVTFSGTNGVVMGMLYRNSDNSINANVPYSSVNVSTRVECHFRIQPKWANMLRSN